MTVPNGAAGINTTDGFMLVSAYDHGDLSAADLVGNDEDTVRALYSDRYIMGGNSVFSDPTGPLAMVWDGLRQGISLPLSIIEAIIKKLFGIDISFDTVDGALSAIQQVIGLFQLPSLLSLIPVSSIGAASPNLLYSGNFETADTINGESIWTWFSGGIVSPGGVQVVANGTQRHLYSNTIPVAPDQELSLSVQTKWDTLTATGSPIVLAVTEYLAGVQVSTATIASVANPGATSDWTSISGVYTVPADIDEIRLQLQVLATATAGNVYFDDAQARKTGLMSPDLVTGLSDLFTRFSTLIDGLFNALTGSTGGTGIDLPTLFSGITDFRDQVSSKLDDLVQLLTHIIGLVAPGTTIPSNPLDIISTAVNIFTSWWGITTNVVSQAQTAATQTAANTAAITATASGGTSVTDLEFNTTPTVNISGNYTTLYLGNVSAGGTLNADGLGSVIWVPSGGFVRDGYARHTTALTTDNFETQLILDGGISAQSFVWLLARVGTDLKTWVGAKITNNSAVIGGAVAFSNGNFSPLSPAATIVSGADSWILRGGYTASGWQFKLLQNNSTVIDFTDNGHNTPMGVANRGVGFGLSAGISGGVQVVPPKIASFTAADRNATAP